MTVELTDDEARELSALLRAGERQIIAEFATDDVDVDETDAGEWANELEDRVDGSTDLPPIPGVDDPVTFEPDDPTDPEAYVRAAYRAQASALTAETIYGTSYVTVDEDGIHVAVEAVDISVDAPDRNVTIDMPPTHRHLGDNGE